MRNIKTKAVVLFFTLLVLVTIFTLIAQSSNITNKFFASTNNEIIKIQINRLLLDTITILDNAVKNLKGDMALDNRANIDKFLDMIDNIPIIPINDNITISPPQVDYNEAGKIYIKNFANIDNELNVTSREYKILFEQLCLYYNISDEYLLFSYMKRFKNVPIVTSSQIDFIVDDYYLKTQDKSIFKWRDSVTYIDFGGTDSAYLSKGLEEVYQTKIFTNNVIKNIFKNKDNIKKFKFKISGTINQQDFQASFVFDFNDINKRKKRVSNLEVIF